jgi:alpha-beta hydrolase superfamily lysophospholipase
MNNAHRKHSFLRAILRTAFIVTAILNLMGTSRAENANEITSLLIHVKTGITLNYAVQGDPQGPVIVLLHGAGDSWHSYDRVLPLLPQKYRVYAITLRGHGLSDHPESGYARADFAADILDFLDQLHIRHATLVGHSL